MTKEELEFLTIHELRIIARGLNINHPSMLKKSELINAISNVNITSSEIKVSDGRGRKAHAGKSHITLAEINPQIILAEINPQIILEIENILNKAKEDILNLLKENR